MTVDIKPLQVLDKIFKEHNITYWLEGGTLIGAIREGELIEWDSDIDVSVFFKDLLRIHLLKKEFKKYGYNLAGLCRLELNKNYRHLVCIIPIKICDKRLVTNEMFFIIRRPMASIAIFAQKYLDFLLAAIFSLSMILSFKKMIFGEHKYLGNFAYVKMNDDYYPIPEYVEKYLTYRFPNWQVPCKGMMWKEKEIINSIKTYKNWRKYR